MNLNHPQTKRKLANLALLFLSLGIWATVMALLPRAVDQRLGQLEATAQPNVDALESRQAADEALRSQETAESQPTTQETQSLTNGEPSEPLLVFEDALISTFQAVPEQTDGNPCITADGTSVCPFPDFGVVATNCLPFGTEVFIANETYVVHDRMSSRYACDGSTGQIRFDILTRGENFQITADVYVL
uniref:Uncharacterized protein n=1 Tax=Eiseniibacteriota bacterium TaxID=2212470 RepID=A0A832MLC9_UNCEI